VRDDGLGCRSTTGTSYHSRHLCELSRRQPVGAAGTSPAVADEIEGDLPISNVNGVLGHRQTANSVRSP
jgi:hypothetical protein